jgi:sister-chromatid-cohesion protein PDS5
LPIGLFAALPNHDVAQEIAERAYLPDDMDEKLDKLVRNIDKKRVSYL